MKSRRFGPWTAAMLTALLATACGSDGTGPNSREIPSELNPCSSEAWPSLVVGETVSGDLQTASCDIGNGMVADIFQLDVAEATSFTMRLEGRFDPVLLVGPSSDPADLYAFDDDNLGILDSEVRILVVPGSYLVYASHHPRTPPLERYDLTVLEGGGQSRGCRTNLWLVSGVTTQQAIERFDCRRGDGGRFDKFSVTLSPGETLTVTQESAEIDPFIRLVDELETIELARDDDGGGGSDARLVYTVPGDRAVFPFIRPEGAAAGDRGAYTMAVEIAAASGPAGFVAREGVVGPFVDLPLHLLEKKGKRR